MGFSQGYFIPQYRNSNFDDEANNKRNANFKTSLNIEQTNKVNELLLLTLLDSLQKSIDLQNEELKNSNYETNLQKDKDIKAKLTSAQFLLNTLKSYTDIDSLNNYLSTKNDTLDQLSEDDTKTLNVFIKTLKIKNTKNNFLTTWKSPISFCILESNKYDLETMKEYFYSRNNVNTFSNFAVQTFGDATYINSELVNFHFNYVRLGVSASIKAVNNSTTDAAEVSKPLSQIFQNSGAVNLNFALPVFFDRNRNDQRHFSVFAETSFGLTPNLNNTDGAYFSNDLLVNNQTGLNFKFDVSSDEKQEEKKARFYFEFPVKYIFGNKKSYQLLDINDNTSVKLNVGAVLGDKISFQISGPLFSTSDVIMKIPYLFTLNIATGNLTSPKEPAKE